MYLDVLLIDAVDADGTVTSLEVRPGGDGGSVVVDRASDIDLTHPSLGSRDVGGVRIYNAEDCRFALRTSRLRSGGGRLEHMGIPVGAARDCRTGFYNLIGPVGHRFTDLVIVDPYDKSHADESKKRRFQYRSYWDPSANASMAEMQLRSPRGSFSMICMFTTGPVDDTSREFVEDMEDSGAIARLLGNLQNAPRVVDRWKRALTESVPILWASTIQGVLQGLK